MKKFFRKLGKIFGKIEETAVDTVKLTASINALESHIQAIGRSKTAGPADVAEMLAHVDAIRSGILDVIH
jgi:hypothetical protein